MTGYFSYCLIRYRITQYITTILFVLFSRLSESYALGTNHLCAGNASVALEIAQQHS
jgi:hypothetical protein